LIVRLNYWIVDGFFNGLIRIEAHSLIKPNCC
jgi:hypothetical protein